MLGNIANIIFGASTVEDSSTSDECHITTKEADDWVLVDAQGSI